MCMYICTYILIFLFFYIFVLTLDNIYGFVLNRLIFSSAVSSPFLSLLKFIILYISFSFLKSIGSFLDILFLCIFFFHFFSSLMSLSLTISIILCFFLYYPFLCVCVQKFSSFIIHITNFLTSCD